MTSHYEKNLKYSQARLIKDPIRVFNPFYTTCTLPLAVASSFESPDSERQPQAESESPERQPDSKL